MIITLPCYFKPLILRLSSAAEEMQHALLAMVADVQATTNFADDTGPGTPGGRGAWLPFFCVAKRKKGEKGKKERVRKQKLLKGCHQGQNVTVLAILKCLEFKIFSCRATMVADNAFQCSMVPPL